MKNLVLVLVLAVFALPSALSAGFASGNCFDTCEQNIFCEECYACNPWTVQVRGAAFIPLNNQLRKIYSSGLPTLEFEGSYSCISNIWLPCDQILLWGNVGWTSQRGRSLGFGYYTNLNLVPLSFGFEYQAIIADCFEFYAGFGPTYSFLRIKNYDGFRTTHLSRNNVGVTTKTGIRYTFFENYFIDVFADYFYTHFRSMNHDPIQPIPNHFSGFFVGGGLGATW